MLPSAFLARMEALLGAEYPAFRAALDEPRSYGLRANTLKVAPERLSHLLGLPLEQVPWAPAGFYFPASARPGIDPLHAAGLYYIQEPSAMAAAQALAPRPGERVLDLCAAPGGKATHLLAMMANQGLLVANEPHPKRAQILAENLERMGAASAAVLQEEPERLVDRFSGFFDRILVDAPCSGEGMFRKLSEAGAEWSPESPAACARRQERILAAAVAMLRPGGYLLYSTCTFAPEENEQVLFWLLRTYPDVEAVPITGIPGASGAEPDWAGALGPSEADAIRRAVRLWPHRVQGEGHFLALLRREGALEPGNPVPERADTFAPGALASAGAAASRRARERQQGKGRPAEGALHQAASLVAQFAAQYLTQPLSGPFQLRGEALYQVPPDVPDLAGLRVLRPGLHLGYLRKGRFEPAHALALALPVDAYRQTVELTPEQALRYLRGETLPASEGAHGWTVVTRHGAPLGWAKAAGGVLKNHYPKGLRWQATGARA